MVAYFFYMATEVALVNTSSCVSEIIEVHSDILVDLLVVLVKMLDAVGLRGVAYHRDVGQ